MDIPEIEDITSTVEKMIAEYERMSEDPSHQEYALTMLDMLCGDMEHLVAHCRYTIMQLDARMRLENQE